MWQMCGVVPLLLLRDIILSVYRYDEIYLQNQLALVYIK
jgi:hypothetical protein